MLADTVRFVDYSGQETTLELRAGVLRPATSVLVVDDWIETGAQVTAAIALVEGQAGIVAGIAGLHMDGNDATRRLAERYPCRVLSGWLTGQDLGPVIRRGPQSVWRSQSPAFRHGAQRTCLARDSK